MKKLATLSLLTLGATAAQAQITIQPADFPATAATVDRLQPATAGSLSSPTLGSNQTWDYRGLVASGAVALTTYNPAPVPAAFAGTVRTYDFGTTLGPFTIAARAHEGFDADGFAQLGSTLAAQSFPLAFATGGATDVLVIPAQSVAVNTLALPLPLDDATYLRNTQRTVTNTQLSIAGFGLNSAPFRYVQRTSTADSVVGWGTLRVPMAGRPGGSPPRPVLLVRRVYAVQDSFYLGSAPAPAPLVAALGQTQGSIRRRFSQSFYQFGSAQPMLVLDYATSAFAAPVDGAYSAEADLADLLVTDFAAIPAGDYRNITITGTGFGRLTGPTTVSGACVVEPAGYLSTNGQVLGGTGRFALGRLASLAVFSPAGLHSTGASGDIQVAGPRYYSPRASYTYFSGGGTRATGPGLPSQVLSLVCSGGTAATTLVFSRPVAVRRMLSFGADVTPDYTAGGITLLSDADTTAAVNYDTGNPYPGTYTVQRYVNGDLNAGAGYRHFSPPVTGATVGSLAVAGRYTPVVGSGYNSSATPGTFVPYPTVFGYDESRLATATNNLNAFDKGWVAPGALSDPLEDGLGYTVHMPGNTRVTFMGPIRSSSVSVPLTRGAGPDAGWNLLGNPFAAPFYLGSTAGTPDVDEAKYVFETSGPYAGSYRTFLPGQGGNPDIGNGMVAIGQAFFTRVSAGASSAAIGMSSLGTDPNDLTVFHRQAPAGPAAAPRPLLALALSGAAGRDRLTVYQQAAATGGFDARFDAAKLANPSGLSLAAVAASGEVLAIDARPVLAPGLVVPLRVEVPAAGRYTLALETLEQLPAGLVAYLRDAATGLQTILTAQASANVQLAAGRSTRFSLVFAPAGAPLAAAPALSAAQVALYPNPAGKSAAVTVALPVPAGTRQATATLLNGLGQVLRTAALPAAAGQASGPLPTAGLPAGVYVLRLSAGAESVSKRLVLE